MASVLILGYFCRSCRRLRTAVCQVNRLRRVVTSDNSYSPEAWLENPVRAHEQREAVMAECQADRYRCLALLVSSYRFCVDHFTAPNDSPRTSCFWLIQPKIRIGAQARVDTAESLAQNKPSGLE